MFRSDSQTPIITDDIDDIFTVASEFDHPVVRKHAAALRDAQVTLSSFDRPTIVDELVECGIPRIPASDITDAFRNYRRRGKVGFYWDIENIPLPPNVDPVKALKALRDKILQTLGDIVEFKVYMDMEEFVQRYSPETRVAFMDCGIQLISAPHNGRKEVADKQIIVDAMWFVQRTKDAIVCLMTGDSDFSPLLSRFRMDGVRSMLITAKQHVRSLREQANWVLVWPDYFLKVPPGTVLDGGVQRNRGFLPGHGGNNSGYVPSPSARPGAVSPSKKRYYNNAGNITYNNNYHGNYYANNNNGNDGAGVVKTKPPPPTYAPLVKQTTSSPAAASATVVKEEAVDTDPPTVAVGSTTPPHTNEEIVPTTAADVVVIESNQGTPQSLQKPFIENEDEEDIDPVVRDLMDCIRKVQNDTGMKKVRRSAVGVVFRKLTGGVTPLKEAMSTALEERLVVIGGSMGHAWIALASDHVNEDDPNMTLPVTLSSDSLATAAPTPLLGSPLPMYENADWYLSLRYSKSYTACRQLNAFSVGHENPSDNALKVMRVQEPNEFWTRLAIGPFPSMKAADDYFTENFSGMELLPKVTNNLEKYFPKDGNKLVRK